MSESLNGWTVATLKEHVEAQLIEHDRRYEQRFVDQDRAVQAALAAAKEAVTKAEQSTEKRLEGLNELRGIVTDGQKLLMPRAEVTVLLDAMGARISRIEQGESTAGGRRMGLSDAARIGYGVALLLVAIIGVLVGIYVHH